MDKIYKGITDLEHNCTYVCENNCYYVGQGLVYSYRVLILGTGENIYTFNFLDKEGNKHTFKTCDNFILKWASISFPENESSSEYNDFDFEAYGQVDGSEYEYLYNHDCEDNTLFNSGEWILQNIRFQLNDLTLKPTTGIRNCYIYIRQISTPNRKHIENNEKLLYSDDSDNSDDSDDDENRCILLKNC